MGWQTYQYIWHVSTISLFVAPQWTDIARPLIYGVATLMNLGVLVSNVITLRRR
jgi:hypothetical protein